MRHSIATCNPAKAAIAILLLLKAMDKRTLVAQNQHNVAGNWRLASRTLNREDVPRPERGEHTASERAQPYDASASQNLRRKINLMSPTEFSGFAHTGQRARNSCD